MFVNMNMPKMRDEGMKNKGKTLHTRITEDEHRFLLQTYGEGYMSHAIRKMIETTRKTCGNPREILLANIERHDTEAAHARQALLELDAENAQKEKEEHDHATKRENVSAMLVNASRQHTKIDPLLWKTASEKTGIPVLELRKIVKEKSKR